MRKVEVIDYDPTWPERFEAERRLLRRTLGAVALEIHHIGSTSVPGLAAKPIIDMVVEVRDLEAIDERTADLEAIGYEARGEFGIPGRRYFRKGGDDRTHHIHAFARGDFNVTKHLVFRDYLRAHPRVAQEYGELKKEIARGCDNDIHTYCDRKDGYLKRVLAMAMREMAPESGTG